MASSDIPLQIAETIQTAHIKRDPSPAHDLNPSTAASKREPVQVEEHEEDDGIDVSDDGDEKEYNNTTTIRSLRPKPRRNAHNLPPLPDLRYEQSYLHSIRNADTWWKVAWITTRDQVMMPLAQGVVYNLGIVLWQHWNRTAQIHGSSVGARVRRWWYGVNNWPIPPPPRKKEL